MQTGHEDLKETPMETKFNFNSQVCTNRSQSERLLELGLKKETADMFWWDNGYGYCAIISRPAEKGDGEYGKVIPAWSLHRLLILSPERIKNEIPYFTQDGNIELVNKDGVVTKAWGGNNLYDAVLNFYIWLIKNGYFNNEYLENE